MQNFLIQIIINKNIKNFFKNQPSPNPSRVPGRWSAVSTKKCVIFFLQNFKKFNLSKVCVFPTVGESLGRQVFASSPGISPDSNGDAMEMETFNDLLQMDAFGGTGSVDPLIR